MADSTDLSGPRGWLLVGLIALTLVVVPAAVWYLTIGLQAGYGVYVALAMLPALLFGAIGVWTALRHRDA
ncbi:MAG: hypothetical protein ACQEQY_11290, partial [Halobacteriota archaeon]